MAIPVTIAASEICLIPIHSPPISMQAVEKVYTLSLMRKRAHSDASMRDSAGHRVRSPNGTGLMGTLMGTLWERARCADAQLLNFQEEMARPERFELPTPRFVVWCSIQLSYGR